MSLRLTMKLLAVAMMIAGAVMASQFAGTTKIVGMALGIVGLVGFLVLAVFTGGGNPKDQAGSQPPPLRWGG